MRGKAFWGEKTEGLRGITPAYAGKRFLNATPGNVVEDHPRVCGEKYSDMEMILGIKGSPPRMRGKD